MGNSSNAPLGIALVGIGGYGNVYLAALFRHAAMHSVQIVGVVDPAPQGCQHLPALEKRRIPIFNSMEALFDRHRPNLTLISTPPQLHSDQTVYALQHGSHILCEKPLCSTLEQADAMMHARDLADRQVSVGYQWSFSAGIQALKRDIATGIFGEPKRFRTLVLWPRDEGYYSNGWKGKRYTKSGQAVFDSPLNNACGHHLHNMLYLLGDSPDRSVFPAAVNAELYRANNIETFDTAAVRVWTAAGVEMICIVSHATEFVNGPLFTLEFEHATITLVGEQPTALTTNGPDIFAQFHDGTLRRYSSPEMDPERKLWAAVESARKDVPTVCGIEASLSHLMAVRAINEQVDQVSEFPADMIQSMPMNMRTRRVVTGLDAALLNCYAAGRLPSELNYAWAHPGRESTIPHRTIRATEFRAPTIPEHVEIMPFAAKRAEPAV